MKKNTKLFTIILISGTILVSSVYALTGQPGSSSDPVVTKSYVDQKILELSNNGNSGIGSGNSQLTSQIKAQQEMIDLLVNEVNNLKNQKNSSQMYEVVMLAQGQKLLGKQGTEIIVRSGKGNVVASEAGGIQDITEGKDLKQGQVAPSYHLMIVPKEDGRGIIATTPLIVMVRGGHSIQ